MKKDKIITKNKIDSAEDLIMKMNNSFFSNQELELSKGEYELSIIEKINTSIDVDRKLRNSMSVMMRKGIRPRHNINMSLLSSNLMDKNNNPVKDIKPDDVIVNTLPTTITKELRASGVLDVKWSNVKDLPGYFIDEIRNLGNQIFKFFDLEENADVMTLSSFKNDTLLNEPRELNAVLGFLEKNAISTSEGTMKQDFNGTIDGYTPEIKLYYTPSMAYLVVFEGEGMGIEGNYIYAYKRKQTAKLNNEIKNKIEENKKSKKIKPY